MRGGIWERQITFVEPCEYAYALSRRFQAGDLAIRRTLRHSVMAGMKAPADSFSWRPLGEHSVFLRRQCYQEQAADWRKSEMRLLCPQTDPDWSCGAQVEVDGSSSSPSGSQLDPSVLVQARVGYQHDSMPTPTPTGGSVGGDAPSQPSLATPLARNQRLTYFPFDVSAMESGGAIRERRLLWEYAWSARTIGARASQWKCYRMFCKDYWCESVAVEVISDVL
jgi:hypothetical protein